MSISQPGGEFSIASILLDEFKAEGTMLSVFINVGDTTQKGVEDDLRVVLEKVDLKNARSVLITKTLFVW